VLPDEAHDAEIALQLPPQAVIYGPHGVTVTIRPEPFPPTSPAATPRRAGAKPR
jgi:hypothetical protein